MLYDDEDCYPPNPLSGFPRRGLSAHTLADMRRRSEAIEAADEAASRLMASAEALTALCDRHSGDSGDCYETIDALAQEIDDLADRIRATLGEPRVIRNGVLVPVGLLP